MVYSELLGRILFRRVILSKDDGKLLNQLFRMRQTGDYDDLYDWEEEKVKPLFEPTYILIKKIEGLIKLEI